MRVLHLIGTLDKGGAEAVLFSLATYPHGVEHRVVSIGPPAAYSAELEARGVGVDHLGVRSMVGGLKALRGLVRIVKKRRPDVVQTWMYRSNVIGALMSRITGVPVVWGIHCAAYRELSLRSKLWVYLNGLLARTTRVGTINCAAVSAEVHGRIGFDRQRVSVVPNGYDTTRFVPDPAARPALAAAMGAPEGAMLIGSVTRWHPQKDVPNLIEALRLLRDQTGAEAWRCILVGRDLEPDNRALAEALARAGLAEAVTLAGIRDDIPMVMAGLDLHLLPSAEEAFPNVIAEAMACGTPCVTTAVGDAPLIVGETGWAVPPRDPAALAAAVCEAWHAWRSDPAAWEARGAAARRRIVENFSLERMADAYEAVWRRAAVRG